MIEDKKNSIIKLAFILGFTSIVGQVLLLRELVSIFYGNETAYAIILASWLFWVAVGSFTFSRIVDRIKKTTFVLSNFYFILYLILPVNIFICRNIKNIINIPIGEIIGIIPMCIVSFTLVAPLTFVLGAMFTVICRFMDQSRLNHNPAIGIVNIYIWESIGAAIGGILFSFLLVHILPAMHIAFFVSILNIAAFMILNKKNKIIFKLGLFFVLLTLVAFPAGLISKFDEFSRQMQWKGFDLLTVKDSIYGNIAIAKLGDEYSIYENGLLSATTKCNLENEEIVHYPLLEHPEPKNILLLGNGLTGGINEILKYAPNQVDYIELDPEIIEVAKVYFDKELILPLEDKRVNVINTDARLFIKRTAQKYDVVIINLSDPYTALINRYYSLEFYRELNKILTQNGVIALSVSSSENYLNKENKNFLRTINSTLKKIFPEVKAIPGDTNIFLACKKPGTLTLDYNILIKRLNERGIETKYIREYYLPFKLSKDRIAYIEDILKVEGAINMDTHPVGYLYDIVLWSTHFNTKFKNLIERIQGIKFRHLMVLPVLILLIGYIYKRKYPTSPISLSIMTTGFSEIIFQIIVILAFQTLYGYAYYKIGLIMASFMAGLVLGSIAAKKVILNSNERVLKFYKFAQGGICLYPFILPFVFIFFRDTVTLQRFTGLFAGTFAALPVIAGFVGGFQYPLALHLCYSLSKKKSKTTSESAGFLYAIDVLGATIGALITGTILIPLVGINAVAFLCAGINTAVFLLLLPVSGK